MGTFAKDVYQHPDEFLYLMDTLMEQFPEALSQVQIGTTYE